MITFLIKTSYFHYKLLEEGYFLYVTTVVQLGDGHEPTNRPNW